MVDLKTEPPCACFILRAPIEGPVSVVGDFNCWQPGSNPMCGTNGCWVAKLSLPPGRYRYGFAVRGAVLRDPNPPVEDFRHGWPWSVVEIPPPSAFGKQPTTNLSQCDQSPTTATHEKVAP